MWFKNLQLFRLPEQGTPAAADLEAKLIRRPLLPCGATALEARGWVSPVGTEQLVYALERNLLIALGLEQKLLPNAVINQAAQEKAEQIERSKGFKPGRKQLREIKELVTAELAPRAFAKRSRSCAWLSPDTGWLIVDAVSQPRAEELVDLLRDTLGEFPVTLPDLPRSPTSAMTDWLEQASAPGNFSIDDECELAAADESRASVRYLRHDLATDEIRKHIRGGKFARRLALSWNDRVSFVLDDKLQIKRVRLLDIDEGDEQETDAAAQFDADFLLMAGLLAPMLDELMAALASSN